MCKTIPMTTAIIPCIVEELKQNFKPRKTLCALIMTPEYGLPKTSVNMREQTDAVNNILRTTLSWSKDLPIESGAK